MWSRSSIHSPEPIAFRCGQDMRRVGQEGQGGGEITGFEERRGSGLWKYSETLPMWSRSSIHSPELTTFWCGQDMDVLSGERHDREMWQRAHKNTRFSDKCGYCSLVWGSRMKVTSSVLEEVQRIQRYLCLKLQGENSKVIDAISDCQLFRKQQ